MVPYAFGTSLTDVAPTTIMLVTTLGFLRKAGSNIWTLSSGKRQGQITLYRETFTFSATCYYPALEWEPLLVYHKPGDMPKMAREGRDYMSRYHTDVWKIPAVTNQMERFGHPAACPVEIPYRSIQAYTGSGDSVFEPFGGWLRYHAYFRREGI